LDDLTAATPSGAPFTQALSREYRAFADADRAQYDWINSWYFARKGLDASNGVVVAPEDPTTWSIGDQQALAALVDGRVRLVKVLGTNAPVRAPALTATAQVKYDCWVEKQDYTWKEADIAACRTDFLAAMDALEKQAPPMAAEAPAAPAVVAAPPGRFELYFNFDQAALTPDAEQVVATAAKAAKAAGYPVIRVVGYTDHAGSDGYNLKLSTRRAEVVKKALVAAGVPADRVTVEGRGAADPLVPTRDGVREPKNRRAVISFVD
jgi:OOP family OmpA-OmpF porin